MPALPLATFNHPFTGIKNRARHIDKTGIKIQDNVCIRFTIKEVFKLKEAHMPSISRRSFIATGTAGLTLAFAGCSSGAATGSQETPSRNLAATQTIVVEGFDWGPNVTKTVIDFGNEIDPETISAAAFTVSDRRQDYVDDPDAADGVGIVEHDRTVSDAYPSDEKGNKVDEGSRYVTLEMAVGPSDGNCQIWLDSKSMNFWSDPYELNINLSDDAALAFADGTPVETLEVSTEGLIDSMYCPVMDLFTSESFEASDGTALTYASFEPEADDQKHPLVIWLHGAGGGGTDVRMAVYDTKCTSLVQNDFQESMGGAYILIPQCNGFWLQYEGMGDADVLDNPGTDSIWKPAVLELIDSYVEEHPDIDPGRILVGGCSNGGYLTLDLVFERPDYFAAAFPISEAYRDSGISDEMIESIKDLPMWFVYTHADIVVDPTVYEDPTIERLKAAGATDLHISVYDDATILDGEFAGYTFEQGHEAWIYFFNGQCTDEDGLDMWDWLASTAK